MLMGIKMRMVFVQRDGGQATRKKGARRKPRKDPGGKFEEDVRVLRSAKSSKIEKLLPGAVDLENLVGLASKNNFT